MADFIPRPDRDLLSWSKSFVNRLQSRYASYGITEEQADDILARQQAFAESYQLSQCNDSRTPSMITRKDTDRNYLIEGIRPLARIIRTVPGITPQMLNDIGMPIPKQRTHRIGPPDEAPHITATAIAPQRIRVQLERLISDTPKRKPDGATAAAIFIHLGENPPASKSDWRFHSNQSKTTFIIQLEDYVTPGQMVWINAYWISARAEKGPNANGVFVRLAGGEPGIRKLIKAA